MSETSPNITDEKMSPQNAIFIVEYLKDMNGAQAAIRAGYSKDSAKEIAYQLLQRPHIKKEIERQLDARSARTLITADKILFEMWQIADYDPQDAYEPNGDLKALSDMPVQVRKAIAGLEVEAMYEMDYSEKGNPKKVEVGLLKKVKFWSKDRAQENLAKHLKLLSERFEIGVLPGSDFKFPGVTEVFVDSPDALQEALELAAQPKIESDNVTATTDQPQ